MKRLTAPWTAALATATLIALPVAGSAQTPQTPPEPQPQQSTTLSTPSAQDQKPTESESPAEHLRQAKAAVENVDANNVPARAKTQLAALKRHINSLERSVAANDNASTTGADARSSKATSGARGKANWAADVAAIDKIISELTAGGSAGAMGSGQSSTTGTSGAESRPNAKTDNSPAMTLDETSRGQLMEVRSHITAFAAAMSGTAAPAASSSSSPAPNAAHSASAHGSAATGHAGAATAAPTGSASGETAQTSQPAPTAGQSSATGTAGQTEPTGQTGSVTGTTGQAPTTGEPGQPAPAEQSAEQSNVNPEVAKQHLTAARDSLTQLTQLPAAAQLQGDARTQVSQLIQNFNELITTQESWRSSYEKVEANLTALIGPDQEKTDAAAAPTDAPQPTTPDPSATTPPSNPPSSTQGTTPPSAEGTQGTQGTPGAVGTSGTTAAPTLDPAVKQKLVEFRNHLKAFHAAAGGDEK